MTDCWMVRNELDRCTREIRHDLIVAPRGCFRLEGATSPSKWRAAPRASKEQRGFVSLGCARSGSVSV